MLLQQRAADKDLYPSLWDYSVGEHLQPGESFLAGAKRGLVEELGLTRVQLEPVGSLRWVEQQGTGYIDREIQQAYRCVIPDLTNVQIDHVEVQQVAFVDLAVLAQNLRDDPGLYTPWLAEDLQVFGWVDVF